MTTVTWENMIKDVFTSANDLLKTISSKTKKDFSVVKDRSKEADKLEMYDFIKAVSSNDVQKEQLAVIMKGIVNNRECVNLIKQGLIVKSTDGKQDLGPFFKSDIPEFVFEELTIDKNRRHYRIKIIHFFEYLHYVSEKKKGCTEEMATSIKNIYKDYAVYMYTSIAIAIRTFVVKTLLPNREDAEEIARVNNTLKRQDKKEQHNEFREKALTIVDVLKKNQFISELTDRYLMKDFWNSTHASIQNFDVDKFQQIVTNTRDFVTTGDKNNVNQIIDGVVTAFADTAAGVATSEGIDVSEQSI